MGGTEMRRALWWTLWLLLTGLIGSGLLLARSLAPRHPAAAHAPKQELKLFETVTAKGKRGKGLAAAAVALRINPGKPEEAEDYYNTVRKALGGFPQPTLQQSKIADMLVYYGFPALLAKDLERLDSAVIMDFEKLRKEVSNGPEFEAAYRQQPLKTDEILVTRF